MSNTRVFWTAIKDGGTGYKQRVAGNNRFFTKAYDASGKSNDLTQTIELLQPFMRGFIAPNENKAVQCVNGGDDFIAHTPINYPANQSFSVTLALNFFGVSYSPLSNFGIITAGNINQESRIGLGTTTSNPVDVFYIRNSAWNVFPFTTSFNVGRLFRGKNIIISIVVNANEASLYANGSLIQTIAVSGDFGFQRLFSGTSGNTASANAYYYRLQDGAMTAQQVEEEHTFIRSWLPEIESVQIGTQTWATSNLEMVTTPMGNVIPEVQLGVNTERITNAADREFSSDTGFWNRHNPTVAIIEDGVCKFNSSSITGSLVALNRPAFFVSGRKYFLRYTIKNYVSGRVQVQNGGQVINAQSTPNGSYTHYFTANQSNGLDFYTISNNTILEIDDISLIEVGWAGLQEVYDHVFATTSGTTAQKEAAAAREAAAWCYYNNDPALGAIHGKLYNWYAARLLQNDIDDFNAANPSTPWGWRVPVQADFATLINHLGGDSVAGGPLKLTGTQFWGSPNTGATNTSGFSAIGSGIRNNENGNFENLTFQLRLRRFDVSNATIISSTAATIVLASVAPQGNSIRIIKS